MSQSVENDFGWFDGWVNQQLGVCLSFARHKTWAQVVEAFGLSPEGARHETFVQAAYESDRPKLRAGEHGPWGYTVEHLTTRCSDAAILGRLSDAGGEAVSLSYTQTISLFQYAHGGTVVTACDMTVPQIRYGSDAHRLDAHMEQAGFLETAVPRPASMGARLLQRAFGITITADILEAPLPSVETTGAWDF